jgi:hypothetical protein
VRRAIIVAVVGTLLTMLGAAYNGGITMVNFLLSEDGGGLDVMPQLTIDRLAAQSLLAVVLTFAGLAAAIIAARVVLMGASVRNPMRTLMGPIILTAVGALVTSALAIPFIFVLVLAGLTWGFIRVHDEFGPKGKSRLSGAMSDDAPLSDWQ